MVKNLLERGHEIRAITRNTNSAMAKEQANAGVTLVRASLEDTAALTKALEGATSLFAVTTPFEGGPQAETRQGVSAADAAKAAGAHLVFSSVGSANQQTGVPHFDSKYEVEKHIAKIGLRAAVLAPVYFMENLYFGKEQLAKGIYATPLPPTRRLAQVAVADIGAVAVRLLENPGRFAGKRFDLGGDELTGDDVSAILSRVIGRPFTYFRVPLDVIRQSMGEGGAKMYEWFDRVGYTVDRAALHREFPDVVFHDFRVLGEGAGLEHASRRRIVLPGSLSAPSIPRPKPCGSAWPRSMQCGTPSSPRAASNPLPGRNAFLDCPLSRLGDFRKPRALRFLAPEPRCGNNSPRQGTSSAIARSRTREIQETAGRSPVRTWGPPRERRAEITDFILLKHMKD